MSETLTRNVDGKQVKLNATEIREHNTQAQIREAERPKRDKLAELAALDLPVVKLNRAVEDLVDSLPSEIVLKLPAELKQNFADKKQLRTELSAL